MSIPGVRPACEWVYTGVWALLSEWFRVPRAAPELPTRAASDVRRLRPAEGYLRYVKFWFWLLLVPMDLVILIPWIIITTKHPIAGALLAVPALALAFIPDIAVYVGIHLKYDTTWYVLSDRSMRLRRGVWAIHETTITYENIQNVSLDQGPLQRYFGIANVMVHTAGGGSAGPHGGAAGGGHIGLIEGIDNAAEIRDLIMERVRASRSAGLGDDRMAHAASVPAGRASWTPAHLQALRAIRDEARAIRA